MAFCSNRPIERIDGRGLVDFEWKTPNYIPVDGPQPVPGYPGYFWEGLTLWANFGPKIRVYQPLGSCPYKVKFKGGYAQVNVYYQRSDVYGAGKDGQYSYGTTLTHELIHVKEHAWKAYSDYKVSAQGYFDQCFCSKKDAECIANALENEMADYYRFKALFEGALFDCGDYGGIQCVEVERHRPRLEELETKLANAIKACGGKE